jgi:hypothetical protein
MKLTYRGVCYEAEPATLEVTEGEIGGTYRGQNWKFHYVKHVPEPQPVHDLKWRGVAYNTGKPVAIQPTATAQPQSERVVTPARRKRVKAMDAATRTHLANIRSRLEHRLEIAKASGNKQLVQQLEEESKQTVTSS